MHEKLEDMLKMAIHAYPDELDELENLLEVFLIGAPQYYNIIGSHVDEPIGKCTLDGIPDVLSEEPGANFKPISKNDFEREL